MGQQMVATVAAIHEDERPRWEDARRLIGSLSLDDFLRCSCEHESEALLPFEVWGSGEAPPPSEEGLRATLQSDLAIFCEAVTDGSREAAALQLGDQIIVIAGGASAGDEPSELYAAMRRLELVGALAAAGFTSAF